MSARRVAIIGAGPAGLTAAVEFLRRTDIQPIVIEATEDVGGLARTVEYRGNRIDMGGHRFFSKSDRVMDWWLAMMPLQAQETMASVRLSYQDQQRDLSLAGRSGAPAASDNVMLLRRRLSRILYRGKLFRYPLQLSGETILKLGARRVLEMGVGYLAAMLRPIRPEKSLEDFFVNRFGRVLYQQFFREYTEKVWGVPCAEISAEWGAQRIKGLSIRKLVGHAMSELLTRSKDLAQKATETSLIERFLYPKYGPGQMWQLAAEEVVRLGGEVRLRQLVERLHHANGRVTELDVRDLASGALYRLPVDRVVSTMPTQSLIAGLVPTAPARVREIAEGLRYRDLITVGLLLERIDIGGTTTGHELSERVPDNWIYVQEPGVKVGRLQLFNNWSPYMVADPARIWLGLEYFCTGGDELWRMSDAELVELAVDELHRLGVAKPEALNDSVVVRMAKAYPSYVGSYDRFPELRGYIDEFENLYAIGRNGMHRYNNQDHSMLAAMTMVDNIAAGIRDKANIWAVNTEPAYHEHR